MKNKITTLTLTAALSFLFSPSAKAMPSEISVEVGGQVFVKKDLKGSLTVTNPKVIKVAVESSRIHIIGKQIGQAHLFVKSHETTVTVYSNKITPAFKAINEVLAKSPGIELKTEPRRLIVKGLVYRLLDWKAIQNLRLRYPKTIENEATLVSSLLPELKSAVEKDLKNHSIVSTQAEIRDGQVQIQRLPEFVAGGLREDHDGSSRLKADRQ